MVMSHRDRHKKALETTIGLTEREADFINANRGMPCVDRFLKSYESQLNGLSFIGMSMLLSSLKAIRKEMGDSILVIQK